MRPCQKQNCGHPAAATVAVRYATKEIVVAVLAPEADRRLLELCDGHAARLTPPYGWTTLDERRPVSPPRLAFGGDPFASAV
jgi:hypothetical protein